MSERHGVSDHRVRRGLLAGMRIRKKLIFLHTAFSAALATILLAALRPAISEIVERAEINEAAALARVLISTEIADLSLPDGIVIARGSASDLGLPQEQASRASASPGVPLRIDAVSGVSTVVYLDPRTDDGTYTTISVRIDEARNAVTRLYAFMVIALLGVYALVALSLEVFVLPQQVYAPIRRMQRADLAVREGRTDEELIPESAIPADELGEIMRSRNESIRTIREKEHELSRALGEIERVAGDLKRKNHLLEAARRNLADADRLASLGMMSAGISHELNTPLAVLKGMVERLSRNPGAGVSDAEAQLMLRVVGRLERLSESLLDFARVRPPVSQPVAIRGVVEEAATLVRLDRDAREVSIQNLVKPDLIIECDADRMVQVFVNLLRNATDAVRTRTSLSPEPPGQISVESVVGDRDGAIWATITVTDNGPGIEPSLLTTLFEPFVSTRLDSRGTGLGLAVSEGIIREHGGVLVAGNMPDRRGARMEILLPMHAQGRQPDHGQPVEEHRSAESE
ncbi:MAG: hypothetical protein KF902_10400 [Phycisphaeraceae bacterium]|nr:hypothetical protein [Phycisphaeraceae bacterium]